MKKKIGLVIIGLVFILTILAPSFIINAKNTNKVQPESYNAVSNTNDSYIEITLTGEIKKSKHVMKVPKGKTYGEILKYASNILNDYSDRRGDLKKRYYESCEIEILSLDVGRFSSDDNTNTLININSATLEELVTLYGIGNARAKKILSYTALKKITSYQELKKIIGVSDEAISRIKEKTILQ